MARAAGDPIGRAVKRADVMDNLDIERIADPKPEDYLRLIRYVKALAVLDGVGVEVVRGW